mgnify:CR=1 FL=1
MGKPILIRLFGIFVLCLSLLGVAACTVNPATGKKSFTTFMSQEQEIRVGQSEHPKILQSFGGAYDDRELNAYVNRVGRSLAAVSELPNLKFTFTVLNDDVVNAFALPGGFIYISRGLLALVESEAEMAGVLAHEIGHVTARHAAQRYSSTMAANIGLAVVQMLSGPDDPNSGGLGTNQLLGVVAQLALRSYSREQEMESDMLAVRYLVRTSYSPDAMSSFFYKLRAHTELLAFEAGNPGLANQAGGLLSTHPRTADRIKQAITLAKEAPRSNYIVKRDTMLRHVNGLLFGDDPKQGIIKGQRFIHSDLGVTFKVPPAFKMANSPERVVANGPDGAVIIFDMEKAEKAAQIRDLKAYLTDQWGQGLSMKDVEEIYVNGLKAATGQGRVKTKGGGLKDIRLLAIREGKSRLYRFLFSTPPAFTSRHVKGFRGTTYSFRRMTPSETSGIKEMRLRVLTIGRRDTAAGLAARMPMEKNGRRWFEVINGMAPGQPIKPGEKVKIVVKR